MIGSTIRLCEGDRVVIKKLYVPDVAHVSEVRLLQDYLLKKGQPWLNLAMAFIYIVFMRPVEVPRCRWPHFWMNEDKTQLIKFRHTVYKPTNRKYHSSKSYYFKEVEKPIYGWSPWFSKNLILYSRACPGYEGAKLFGFNDPDSLNKIFVQIRKKIKDGGLGDEYKPFLEKPSEVPIGADRTQYRLNPYAYRRFAMTFHYWVTFDRDEIALSRAAGHSNPATTMTHYVRPYQYIGLTEKMIKDKISIDEFIMHIGKQKRIEDFFLPLEMPKFIEPGQRVIGDFFQQ